MLKIFITDLISMRCDRRDICVLWVCTNQMPEQNTSANNFLMKFFCMFGAEYKLTNIVNRLNSSGAKLFYIYFFYFSLISMIFFLRISSSMRDNLFVCFVFSFSSNIYRYDYMHVCECRCFFCRHC